jgi:hypothetical protein
MDILPFGKIEEKFPGYFNSQKVIWDILGISITKPNFSKSIKIVLKNEVTTPLPKNRKSFLSLSIIGSLKK